MKSGTDTLVRLPYLGAVTYNEWHAYALGALVGVLNAALLYVALQLSLELTFLVLVADSFYAGFVLAFGGVIQRQDQTKGLRTILGEPWYVLYGTASLTIVVVPVLYVVQVIV